MAQRNIPSIIARLRKPQKGQRIAEALTYDFLSAIGDFAEAVASGENLKNGLNSRVRQGSSWAQINITIPSAPQQAGSTIFDFTLSPTLQSNAPAITLGFGCVTGNGINLATGVKPYPEEFVGPHWTDTKPVTGSSTDLWYAYIIVTVSGDSGSDSDSGPPEITSVSWDTYTTPQTNTDDRGYILLGAGFVPSDTKPPTVLNTTGIGSQTVAYCGSSFYVTAAGPCAIPP